MDTKIQNTKRELTPEEKKERNTLIYSLLLTLLLCLLGGGNTAVTFIALLGYIPLLLRPECLIGPVLFTSVFDDYILITAGQSLGRYVALFFIVGVLMKIMFAKKRIKIDFWFVITVVITASAVILSFFGIKGYTGFPTTFFFYLLFFFCMLNCPISSRKVLVDQIWWFTILTLAYSAWFLLQNGLSAFEEGRVGKFEDAVNANQMAIGLAMLAASLVAHFLINNFKQKTIHITLILATVFLTFLTGSRTSLIAILLSSVIIFLYWLKLNSGKFGTALLIIILSAVLLYGIYQFLVARFPILMDRFTVDNVVESGASGRIDVWKAFLTEYFPDYWMFGIGFNTKNLFHAVTDVNGIGHGAHNIIIDILASSGIFGLFLYFSLFVKTSKEVKISAKKDCSALLPFAMLVCIIFTGIGENVIRGRLFWFSIALCIIFTILINKEKTNAEEQKND